MASYFDLKGTTIDSFKIGKGGPTLNRSGSDININSDKIITEANIGVANGVASLDSSTLVPDTQISSNIARTSALTLKANLASPTFTGTPTAPTTDTSDNSTKIATTNHVANYVATNVLDSPIFSGPITSAGNVTIGGNSVSTPGCIINGAANTQRFVRFQTAGLNRWLFGVDTATESGSNAGSPLFIQAFTDAGTLIDKPLNITRAAGGLVSVSRPTSITNTTASTSIGTGALTIDGGLGVDGAGFFGGALTTTQFRLSALNTAPASATATGTLGEIRYDANYMYVCIATNTWKRSALTTW
jgi:hypothetical protein